MRRVFRLESPRFIGCRKSGSSRRRALNHIVGSAKIHHTPVAGDPHRSLQPWIPRRTCSRSTARKDGSPVSNQPSNRSINRTLKVLCGKRMSFENCRRFYFADHDTGLDALRTCVWQYALARMLSVPKASAPRSGADRTTMPVQQCRCRIEGYRFRASTGPSANRAIKRDLLEPAQRSRFTSTLRRESAWGHAHGELHTPFGVQAGQATGMATKHAGPDAR